MLLSYDYVSCIKSLDGVSVAQLWNISCDRTWIVAHCFPGGCRHRSRRTYKYCILLRFSLMFACKHDREHNVSRNPLWFRVVALNERRVFTSMFIFPNSIHIPTPFICAVLYHLHTKLNFSYLQRDFEKHFFMRAHTERGATRRLAVGGWKGKRGRFG